MNKLDKCKGSLVGLAIGDALGTTVEFKLPGTFEPMTDLIGGGYFDLEPGQWTDDTSMALCLGDSLIEKKGFDAWDQLTKYSNWYRHGYNSSTGICFDIGGATRQAICLYESSGQPYCGNADRNMAGNGSIMRLAPIAIFYHDQPNELYKYSVLSSKTTHASPQCLDACLYLSTIIAGAINGYSKEDLLSPEILKKYFGRTEIELDYTIQGIVNGSFKEKQPPEINGSGYVVNTLEAALWAFYTTDSFKEGALKVVNLGNDADTTGAVYGQIAGAYYGLNEIPQNWKEILFRREDIENMANALVQ